MLRRLGVILAAVAASFALAASAHAAPTKPGLNPVPYWVCSSSLGISWSPSTPDPGGVIIGYRIDLGDLTTGTSTTTFTSALGTTLNGLIAGHHYVVRVRAMQFRAGMITYSTAAADTFVRKCLFIPPYELVKRYVWYDPWPECPQCLPRFFEDLHFDDPILERQVARAVLPATAPIKGIELDEQGGIIIIGG